MSRRKRHRFKLRSMYNWHRYLGVTAAIFVILLAASGIALNHSEQLKLDKRYLNQAWLLSWYGIDAAELRAFHAEQHWISQLDNEVFVDSQLLFKQNEPLTGAVDLAHVLVIGFKNHISLLTPDGRLIETLNSTHGLPVNITAIGITERQKLIVQTQQGFYISDNELISWSGIPQPGAATWSKPAQLPDEIHQQLSKEHAGKSLTVEQVMLDIHSGSIIGRWGVYVMDGAAIILLFLSASGIWIWTTRRIRMKKRSMQKKTQLLESELVTRRRLKAT